MSPSTSPRPHGDERFFLSLAATYARAQKTVEKLLRPHGLTIAEYALLRIVENRPGVTAGQARARLDATAPSVAQLVKRALDKGFLLRSRDAHDARRQPLRLSKTGSARVRAARSAIETLVRGLPLNASALSSLADQLDSILLSLSV